VGEDLDDGEGDLEGEQPPSLAPPLQHLLSPLHRHVGELADIREPAGDAQPAT